MKEVFYNGHLIGVVTDEHKSIKARELYPIVLATRSNYFADTQGNIYARDIRNPDKEPRLLSISSKSRRWKNPSVRLGGRKRVQIRYLVAVAFFADSGEEITIERIHHFDGNPCNNAISNIYLDLTPREVREEIGREESRKKKNQKKGKKKKTNYENHKSRN